MYNDIIITVAILIGVGVLFFVISITLTKSLSYLDRVVFLLKTEYEYRAEEMEVRKVLTAMEDIDDL